jgi:rhodanese-related sulfurtransferase
MMEWLKQNQTTLVMVAILVLFFGYRLLNKPKGSQLIQARTLAETMADTKYFLLDVREQSEWDADHIKGTKLISLGSLPKKLDKVPKDQMVIIICRSGHRAGMAAKILKRAGYQNYKVLEGGMMAWHQVVAD